MVAALEGFGAGQPKGSRRGPRAREAEISAFPGTAMPL